MLNLNFFMLNLNFLYCKLGKQSPKGSTMTGFANQKKMRGTLEP